MARSSAPAAVTTKAEANFALAIPQAASTVGQTATIIANTKLLCPQARVKKYFCAGFFYS
jgi:hypothetical protein